MNRSHSLFLIFLLILLSNPAGMESANITVHLKDGSKFQGDAARFNEHEEEIELNTSIGRVVIPWTNIKWIERKGRKNPQTAEKLAILPGGGQFYNGQLGKGILVFTGGLTGLYGTKMMATGEMFDLEGNDLQSSLGATIVGLGIYVWSFIDAKKTAESLNRKRGY